MPPGPLPVVRVVGCLPIRLDLNSTSRGNYRKGRSSLFFQCWPALARHRSDPNQQLAGEMVIDQTKFESKVKSLPKVVRIACGVLLVIAGLLGMLPVLGFWMIPLGIAILAIDIPWVHHRWERSKDWLRRRYEAWRQR